MTTNFPTSLDAFTNPSATDAMDSVTVPHASQHANLNDAVEAIETALLDGAPMYIDDTNERVGIGTTSPAKELDVVGDVQFSGTMYGDLPSCVLSNSTQSCNSGVGTVLTYSVEDHDPLGWHSTSSNTGRITPTVGGYYLFVWGCRQWSQITTRSAIFMKKNNSDIVRHDIASATSEGFGCSCVVYMNGTTDYMHVEFYQTSGSAKSVNDAQFSAIRIAG